MNTLQERLRANPLPLPSVIELCREAADRIDALEAENAALRTDAERYRWLRDECTPEMNPQHTGILESPGDGWDAAIDAARGKT